MLNFEFSDYNIYWQNSQKNNLRHQHMKQLIFPFHLLFSFTCLFLYLSFSFTCLFPSLAFFLHLFPSLAPIFHLSFSFTCLFPLFVFLLHLPFSFTFFLHLSHPLRKSYWRDKNELMTALNFAGKQGSLEHWSKSMSRDGRSAHTPG